MWKLWNDDLFYRFHTKKNFDTCNDYFKTIWLLSNILIVRQCSSFSQSISNNWKFSKNCILNKLRWIVQTLSHEFFEWKQIFFERYQKSTNFRQNCELNLYHRISKTKIISFTFNIVFEKTKQIFEFRNY